MSYGTRQHLVDLAWALLEYKLAYYLPAQVHPDNLRKYQIPDAEYDRLENCYKDLCKAHGVTASVSEMVDFDPKRGSSKLVLGKLAMKVQGAVPHWDKVKHQYTEPELLF